MGRIREFDEQHALEAAMHLFWEKGYEAASLSDLTAAMGIQRPSIYSAFGDKKELFEAALRKYNQQHAANARSRFQKNTSVKAAFRAYFESIVSEDGHRGCFCINTMVELAPHDAKFEIITREHQMYLSAIFQEAIERGVQTGELRAGMDAKAVAQTLVVALIGLTVMMKSRPERSFAERAIEVHLSLLG
ncbi:TetR/AcrR family transcriptional regulator [Paenibacillus thalictri]|uniref:TetR/AcrR family transcriptional regulator n=1 Tax=Paenibacillus thalictri TaxID=2527873 RepID=A0A4Q9DRP1_9BACL|nr:TetR/AcrR family transcriptional regulator [Paenibacillus thalictri]TBL79464.1 TetR/AcrR family transcriptional regulator [Paenibacillus thalictri]